MKCSRGETSFAKGTIDGPKEYRWQFLQIYNYSIILGKPPEKERKCDSGMAQLG